MTLLKQKNVPSYPNGKICVYPDNRHLGAKISQALPLGSKVILCTFAEEEPENEATFILSVPAVVIERQTWSQGSWSVEVKVQFSVSESGRQKIKSLHMYYSTQAHPTNYNIMWVIQG